MSYLGRKISEARARPYEQRVKILWTSVLIAAGVVIVLWVLTLHFRNLNERPAGSGKLETIWGNIKKLESSIRNYQPGPR